MNMTRRLFFLLRGRKETGQRTLNRELLFIRTGI